MNDSGVMADEIEAVGVVDAVVAGGEIARDVENDKQTGVAE